MNRKGCGKQFNVIKYKKGSKEYGAGILGEAENCLPTNLCPKCMKVESNQEGKK